MFGFLKASTPIARTFMLVPRTCGRLCGIWPDPDYTWRNTLFVIFSTFVMAYGGFGEFGYGLTHLSDLVDALDAFCPSVTKIISFFKASILFVNRRRFNDITERLRTLIMREQHDANKIKLVQRFSSFGNICAFIIIAGGASANMFYNLRAIVTNLIYHFQEEQKQFEFPFKSIVPEFTKTFPYFPFMFLILSASGTMTVLSFSIVDGYFVCTTVLICSIFKCIQNDIRSAFEKLKNSEHATEEQNHRIRQKLYAIVKRHNTIIDLCADFTRTFTVIILLHFMSAAVVVCSSLLDLMLNSKSLGLFIYIFYNIAALAQLVVYCIGGTYVTESSAAVADALYNVEWYKCDVKTRKIILMILHRSQKAITISVPFFTPSLPAFSSLRFMFVGMSIDTWNIFTQVAYEDNDKGVWPITQ
ncbi:odorant receptor 22c [Musca autumnalis]|uniref:odorant receptor 22c n=1 Tax=Musca autumnalis TaxID=221902 RepID=UPI003CE68405